MARHITGGRAGHGSAWNSILAMLALAALGCASLASAADVVNDTWRDGTRSDPASPTYSENGTDVDVDGDIESAWFRGGGGTLSVVNANPGTTPGILRTELVASSTSQTTYFTPEASPVTLAAAGEQIRLTWVFSLSGTNLADKKGYSYDYSCTASSIYPYAGRNLKLAVSRQF